MLDEATILRALIKHRYLSAVPGNHAAAAVRAASRTWVAKAAPIYKPAWSDARVRLATEHLIISATG